MKQKRNNTYLLTYLQTYLLHVNIFTKTSINILGKISKCFSLLSIESKYTLYKSVGKTYQKLQSKFGTSSIKII